MDDKKALQDSINQVLQDRLESFGCSTGRFECSLTYTSMAISMYGIKDSNGKSVFFWEWNNAFKRMVRGYMESMEPQQVCCIITIDLKKARFDYSGLNGSQYQAKLEAEKEQKKREEEEMYRNKRKTLAAQTELYGMELAEQFANTLKPGFYLCYSHRDYCGMGLGMNEKKEYVYGPVWDGGLQEELVFATKKQFTDWLSRQSDASMANLDSDKFAWGNQVITRKRLEEFVRDWRV